MALPMFVEGRSGTRGAARILFRHGSSNAPKRKVPRRKGEYLFGVAPCFAALQAGRRKVYNVFLKEGMVVGKRSELKKTAVGDLQRYALGHKVDIHYVEKDILERLSGKRPHQGIVLDASPLSFKSLDPRENPPKAEEQGKEAARYPVWLALDEVQDPMNFGAMLRCAFFLGVRRVLATANKSCCLSPVVSKASAGAMELMPVHSVRNMAKFLQECAEDGWEVLGACGPDHQSSSGGGAEQRFTVPVETCHQYRLQRPTILVLGNEGHGLRAAVEEACTTLLTIEAHRQLPLGFDSLNVGVAAGILLHSLQSHLSPQLDV